MMRHFGQCSRNDIIDGDNITVLYLLINSRMVLNIEGVENAI
jgi:hypothetical protein